MTKELKFPLRIAIFDDDYYALKWNTALVMRDPRTTVIIETQSPSDLVSRMGDVGEIDIVIVDAEYENADFPFDLLLKDLKQKYNNTVVCLSQYGKLDKIKKAFDLGADSFLLKNDIQMSIVPALIKSFVGKNLISPSIKESMKENGSQHLSEFEIIPKWMPNPEMTPQILTAFWMRVFFGMRSPMAAEEMGVANGTVDRYVNLAYGILPNEFVDEDYLFGLDIDKFSAEDRAFLLFTLPPIEK